MLKDKFEEKDVDEMLQSFILIQVYGVTKEFIESCERKKISETFQVIDDLLTLYHKTKEEA